MNELNNSLEQSLLSGYIDRNIPSNKGYWPQMIVNDKAEGKKVLSTIIQELNNCEEFWFSVAFITTSGVATLIETLISLEHRGIKGKILVSQYLNFTQPEALKRLLQFKQIEIKIAVDGAFHSKGYLFKKKELYTLIIGSSNLTASALCTNIEWNLKITATPNSHIIFNAINEFTTEYKKAIEVDEQFIRNYKNLYNKQLDYTKMLKLELDISNQKQIIPNSMQVEALKNINYLRNIGKTKALLISATGTGKTFLSAFDVKKFNPKKFLFVVHRLNIAKASMKAYQTIIGKGKTFGIFSGEKKELEADFIFSTIQTISKSENLKQFNQAHFEYIVIDESHRSGANTYQNLLNYFKPKFLLGMTATPERTDGEDIFRLFDYNIAYEIRLHQALEEDILCPFHYYGVTDIIVNGELLEETRDVLKLASEERLERIIEKAKFYGSDNGVIKGLIFCSSVLECHALSIGLNGKGLITKSLTSDNNEDERVKAISQLENNELEYIITVDIFNEGIDIPSVNQIIMLRPTQSAIIFVQQLGRGLRKIEEKDYLTVIDFIGNYKNNFLVPVALYGDTSYNKDTLRKLMSSGSSMIPGTSTINFDLIARKKIFDAINNANMQLRRDLVADYNLLKYKLGRIPMMVDFLVHGSRDPMLYVNYSKSYFNFVQSVENGMTSLLNDKEKKLLELFANEINNSKRIEESFILNALIDSSRININSLKKDIKDNFGYSISDDTIQSCIGNLNFDFIRSNQKNVIIINNYIIVDEDLKNALGNNIFKVYLLDSVLYSIEIYRKNFDPKKYIQGLLLYNKYSRKDVCRVLNWPKDISATMFGYRTNFDITPLFVTYHKSNDIVDTINYNDHFVDHNSFAWVSRSNRMINSTEIQKVINSKRILLFIKKEDGEGSDFYYMGDVDLISGTVKESFMKNSDIPVVNFDFKLKHPVDDNLYDYITINLEYKSKQQTVEVKKVHPFKIIPIDRVKPYVNSIPFVKAAAGSFINFNYQNEMDWIEPPSNINPSNKYFVCQIIGESMNKLIPNGAYCLFKNYIGGTREGKVVFAQSNQIQDAAFGSGYTIKEYHSVKSIGTDNWKHESIVLKPKSTNLSFNDIVLTEDELVDFKVIGIFERVL